MLSEMILGNGIGSKLCEGRFIWEATTKIIELIRFRVTSVSDAEIELKLKPANAPGRLQQFGLVNEESKADRSGESDMEPAGQNSSGWSQFSHLFWTGVQYTVIAFTLMRILMVALVTSSSLPARSSSITIVSATPSPSVAPRQRSSMNDDSHARIPETPTSSKTSGLPSSNHERGMVKKRPVVSMRIWSCIGRLVELDMRMPWLAGLLSLAHDGAVSGPGRVGDTDGPMDR